MGVVWLFFAFPLLSLAQIGKPPEFQESGAFRPGAATGTVDGTSHVAAERSQINNELVVRLRALPPSPALREGLRLIDNRLLTAADEHFRNNGLPLAAAVTVFLLGKADASAAALCALATAQPMELTLLPLLGETVGAAPAYSARMLAQLKRLAAAYPENGEAEYFVARALLKQESAQTAEALPHLERAAALDPKDTRALLELARQHTVAERSPQAIEALEEALRRDPSLATAHYRLVQLYRNAGQLERSREHLQQFQKLRR